MKTDETKQAVYDAEMALLDELHFAFKAREQAQKSVGTPDIALGLQRARSVLDAVRGRIHREYEAARTALRAGGAEKGVGT